MGLSPHKYLTMDISMSRVTQVCHTQHTLVVLSNAEENSYSLWWKLLALNPDVKEH
jgi:hypothetical protein